MCPTRAPCALVTTVAFCIALPPAAALAAPRARFTPPSPLPPNTRLSHGNVVAGDEHVYEVVLPAPAGTGRPGVAPAKRSAKRSKAPAAAPMSVRLIHARSGRVEGTLTCEGGSAQRPCRIEVFDHAARCASTEAECRMTWTPVPGPGGR